MGNRFILRPSAYMKYAFIITSALLLSYGCGNDKPKPPKVNGGKTGPADTSKTNVVVGSAPEFNADSAYHYIEKQVAFGPRNPNSTGHKKCGDYLIATLKQWADDVVVQEGNVKSYTGMNLNMRNIIARWNPQNTERILLFAHWDTRPFADRDIPVSNQPILGADDGGSGVGVLLEIARHLKNKPTNVGIDIILFDAEDFGDAMGESNTFCLGSQYWAKNPPIPNYMAKYGILLDMVGAKGAVFLKEGFSRQNAPQIVDKVWSMAAALGYSGWFKDKISPPLVDDHYFVSTLANIPSIDIINYDHARGDVGFGGHWHTHDDTMDIIDKSVLKAVGQTVMEVIYGESLGT